MGWLDKWEFRRFDCNEIERIHIGLRSDFPLTSYSDTFRYIILLVEVHSGSGNTVRYYYGPLQRVAGWHELIDSIQGDPNLSGKVTIGKLRPTGSEISDYLRFVFTRKTPSFDRVEMNDAHNETPAKKP